MIEATCPNCEATVSLSEGEYYATCDCREVELERSESFPDDA